MNMKHLFASSLLALSFFSLESMATEYSQFEATLTVDHLQLDNDDQNEIQIIARVTGGEYNKESYFDLYLKPTTSITPLIGGFVTIKSNETKSFKARFSLPNELIKNAKFSIMMIERDAVIWIPGPCCASASESDYFFSEKIDLSTANFSKMYTPTAKDKLAMTDLLTFEPRLGNIKLEFKKETQGFTTGRDLADQLKIDAVNLDSLSAHELDKMISRLSKF